MNNSVKKFGFWSFEVLKTSIGMSADNQDQFWSPSLITNSCCYEPLQHVLVKRPRFLVF